MKKALLVAKWEFLSTVKRPGYLIMVFAIPLFYGAMFGLALLAGRSASTSVSRVPTAVVDASHVIDFEYATAQAQNRERMQAGEIVATAMTQQSGSTGAVAAAAGAMAQGGAVASFSSLDEALAALKRQEVGAVFAVDAAYMTNGKITAYTKNSGIFGQQNDQRRQTQVADAIRASLMHRSMPDGDVQRAFTPAANVQHLHLAPSGQFEELQDPYGLGPLAGSLGVVLLLSLSIFISAAYLQHATAADRTNRVIEVLLSSVDSNELLAGKLIGLGGAGMLQVAIYVGLVIAPGAAFLTIFQIPFGHLLLMLVYYVIGLALFSTLMTATGMLGRSPQEAGQLSALW
ncbi:MAG TPA: ABC transporter permease, partial [Vicinamibacterales bacterium]|nr:ABC transporter permease [Vicinamibacterales bacterium]